MSEILGCMKESKQYGKVEKTGNKAELAIEYRRLFGEGTLVLFDTLQMRAQSTLIYSGEAICW
jgi:hypothetical protein